MVFAYLLLICFVSYDFILGPSLYFEIRTCSNLALEVSVCYVMHNSTSKQGENGFDLHTETFLQGL